MKPGDLVLVRGDAFVSRAIRWATRSRYNHVRVVVHEDGTCVEARPGGAGPARVEPGDVVVSVPLTDAERADVLAEASRLYGVPYGFLDVAALGLAQFGVVLPSVRKRIARPDRLFCSQLAVVLWAAVGFHPLPASETSQDVSPGDLGDLAFRQGWPTYVA